MAKISLKDFVVAFANGSTKPCTICALKERGQIDAARRTQNIGAVLIIKWLLSLGYAEKDLPSRNQIDRHFRNRHHEQETKS